MTKNTHQHGFHLIEILITLALIAILSQWMSISYQSYIAETRRREAEQSLFALASALEEYAIEHQLYNGVTLRKLHIKAFVSGKSYELKINVAEDNHYLISALPLRRQAIVDKQCGILMLTSEGEKRASGSSHPENCW